MCLSIARNYIFMGVSCGLWFEVNGERWLLLLLILVELFVDHTCLHFHFKIKLGRGGRARMLVGFPTTYIISAYHHKLATCPWFSLVSSTNITDRQDITEILLKVVLHTITLTPHNKCSRCLVLLFVYLSIYVSIKEIFSKVNFKRDSKSVISVFWHITNEPLVHSITRLLHWFNFLNPTSITRATRWVLLVEKEFTNDFNGVCWVQSKAYTVVL